MERIILVGAEDVSTAGYVMRTAAENMLRAANLIDESNLRQREFIEAWLARLQQSMEKSA